MKGKDSDSDDSEGIDALEDFMNRVQQPVKHLQKEEDKYQDDKPVVTFDELGVCKELCQACLKLGWKEPTPIQIAAIPRALEGRDIIGLAVTGSGKTGAFILPVLHDLLDAVQRLYCVVLAPSRELCEQIAEQFSCLGASMAVEVCIIIGGMDMVKQTLALAKKPHVIVGSPGRLADHVENTKGFSLASVKKLIIDEADRLLSQDFDDELDMIINAIPSERQTLLFSATMTKKLSKLQRMALKNPISVQVDDKYTTAEQLDQRFLLVAQKHKWVYLAAVLWHFTNRTAMIFCKTCDGAYRCSAYLKALKFSSLCLHGKMSQVERSKALQIFKSGSASILVATEVGGRGLDLPLVDLVINFDIPESSKDYIHRVGRTARAGRSGLALTYDVELFQRIELALNKKLEEFTEISDIEALSKHGICSEALRNVEAKKFKQKSKDPKDKRASGFQAKYEAAKRKRL